MRLSDALDKTRSDKTCRKCGLRLGWHENHSTRICNPCARRSKRFDEYSEAMNSRDEGLDT